MCGIAGLYNLNGLPVPAHCLKPMCDVMHHRGPDDEGYIFFDVRNEPFKDEGYWVEKRADMPDTRSAEEFKAAFGGTDSFNLALGHRRLAIIDLTETGHQPMSNRANGMWVVYNGEIYNYRELRQELQQLGHRFFSQSDTEVIIHLFEEYGEDAIRRLNGIFAFALWDGRRNRLLIARDRYGAKPLYFTLKNGLLAFASEVKALLQVEGVDAQLDYNTLADYFTFQNSFGASTLFKNIHMLEPGHFLVVENNRMWDNEYWDFDFTEDNTLSEEDCSRQLRYLLADSVQRQLVSDVPLGTYLSGGLDSGSITALASRVIPRLTTFTGGFDVATAVSIENFFDERDKAELMSRQFGTEHYQMVIHAGDLENALPFVIYHTEDLRVGMSYPHYYLSQLASKFVKVVLAGPGGDETLGGYPWRYDHLSQCKNEREFCDQSYAYWSRLVKEDQRLQVFTPEVLTRIASHSPRLSFDRVLRNTGDLPLHRRALYFDAKTFLHGILVVEDKLSMAHSLESRVPFLDNELVDFTTHIPTKYLINHDWIDNAANDVNLSGKYVLRQAMRGILPQEIIENRKQGFSAPDQSWYMQQLVKYISSVILSEQSLDRGIFQREFVETVLNEHVQGRANHRLLIWSLLSFEFWNRIFIDGEDPYAGASHRITLRRRSERIVADKPMATLQPLGESIHDNQE